MFEGGKRYKLHLPQNIPASDFWSIIVYDAQSQLMIPSGQAWPSVFSTSSSLVNNKDGSIDVWFGPGTDNNKESNWIKTLPGRNWFLILRLYYPLGNWFDNSWRPGEIEEIR
jgi:hypothetical protein